MIKTLIYRNITNRFKEYGVYFFTLVINVAIFYIFNAIYFQQDIIENLVSFKLVFEELQATLLMISTFGFTIIFLLTLYANYLFIKQRNYEFNIYSKLGMKQSKINLLVFIETIIIAILALIGGLILGVIFSQLMIIITSNIFEVNITNYHFVIYGDVILSTILYYLIVIISLLIINIIIVNKLIRLPLFSNKNLQGFKQQKSTLFYFILFLLSIIALTVVVYHLATYNDEFDFALFDYQDYKFLGIGIVGIVVLILLCYSQQFIWLFLKHNKKLYFKGINSFVINGINTTIKSNAITQAIILSLLTISLIISINAVIISTGLIVEKGEGTPYYLQYDVSFVKYNNGNTLNPFWSTHDVNYNYNKNITSIWDNLNPQLKDDEYIKDYNELQVYQKQGYTYENLTDYTNVDETLKIQLEDEVQFVGLSQYNKVLKQQNIKPINLLDNQYFVTYIEESTNTIANTLIDNNTVITLDNQPLLPINTTQEISLTNIFFFPAIIVSDNYLNSLSLDTVLLNVNVYNDKHDQYIELLDEINANNTKTNTYDFSYKKVDGQALYYQYKSLINFPAIYFSVIFMIICLVILLFWQFSENNRNLLQYQLLLRYGTSKKNLNKYLLYNNLVFFSFPLVISLLLTLGMFFSKNTIFNVYLDYLGIKKVITYSLYPIIIILLTYIIFFFIIRLKNLDMIRKLKY